MLHHEENQENTLPCSFHFIVYHETLYQLFIVFKTPRRMYQVVLISCHLDMVWCRWRLLALPLLTVIITRVVSAVCYLMRLGA